MTLYPNLILEALSTVRYPGTGKNIVEMGMVADDILEIKTHYEKQWLERGLTIKYLKFHLPHDGELQEPEIEIEMDTYRSYNRGYIQMPQLMNKDNE